MNPKILLISFLLGGCSTEDAGPSTDSNDAMAASEDGVQEGETGAEVNCGDAGSCGKGELCVATRGALCMPLPDEGESCQAGCVLTEHCCNCTAFSCTPLPDECEENAGCGCVGEAQDNGFLEIGCPAERSECSEEEGTTLTCILVDFDEDPFADPSNQGGAAGL